MARKLNSLRLLKNRKIPFTVHEFPASIHNAEDVAAAVGKPAEIVYKTLVVLKNTPRSKPMLVMVAAPRRVNLKKVAQAVDEKKVQMARHAQAEKLTGLQVGGIGALALMNRGFEMYIDEPARDLKTVLVSAGQRGINVELSVEALVSLTGATWINASDSE